MSNPSNNNQKKLSIQDCIYGCGKKIYWNPNLKVPKIKWQEFDTGMHHDYPRCFQLLKEQGKDTSVLSAGKGKKK